MILQEKDKINVLMNIESYYGSHQGRMAPMLTFLLLSAAPALAYAFFGFVVIPLKIFIPVELYWVLFVARKVLWHENEKKAAFIREREDEYNSSRDLIRVAQQYDDGLIEYQNGMVAYILSGFTMTYFSDAQFAYDIEQFLSKLRQYEYDIHCHLVINEDNLQDKLEGMEAYKDSDILEERLKFYMYQDEYCDKHSKLYRYNIVVKTPKYNWKKLKSDLTALVNSEYAKVFHYLVICDRNQAIDVMSRDLCAYLDLDKMLQDKYSNDNYYGSRVLFYGDEVPEKYKKKKDNVNLRERRVVKE